jgi:hypothetical protein
MSDDFRNVIDKVKRDRQEKAAQDAEKWAKEKAWRAKSVERGVAALRSAVLPVLVDARAALGTENITLEIEEDFGGRDVSLAPPRIIVQCTGVDQDRSGGIVHPKSQKMFVSADSEAVRCGFGFQNSDHATEAAFNLRPDAPDLRTKIHEALRHCLESYYRERDTASK